MGAYGVNANNVLRKNTINRRFKGCLIGATIILIVELYLIYNYISYCNTGRQLENNILNVFASFTIIFTKQSFNIALSFDLLLKMLDIWLNIWWLNLIIISLSSLLIIRSGKYKGVEYGSATWASAAERKDFENKEKNIPIQDGLYLNPHNKQLKNLNEIVIADTGGYKTFRKIIPDILQMIGSYIITDTKGALYRQIAKILKNAGYDIKVLNLIELSYSNTFNPLSYIPTGEDSDTESEIDKLVNTFILNSRKDGTDVGDQFWEDTMSMLLTSICCYLVLEGKNTITNAPEDVTFTRIMDLVVSIDVVRGQVLESSEYEQIMTYLEMKNPHHAAVINYKLFKKSAAETLQSILISLASRLRFWATKEVRILTQTDEMDIDSIADKPTAIFIIIPDNDNTYKVISSMFITTLFRRLYNIADFKYRGKLPQLVSFEMDEFSSIGKVPNYDGYIATMRSRNIRSMIVLQNLQQLEKLYDKADKTIISNSMVFNYMGTNDTDTREKIVKMLGKTTIEETTGSRNKGSKGNSSESDRNLGRELLTLDELGKVKNDKSIVFISGFNPFYGDKFHTEDHPLFKYLGNDFTPDNVNNTDIHNTFSVLKSTHIENYNDYLKKSAAGYDAVLDHVCNNTSNNGGQKQAMDIQNEMEQALADKLKTI